MQNQNNNEIVFPEARYKAESTKLSLACILQNEENQLYDRNISIQRQEQRTNTEKEEFRKGIMKSLLYGFKIPPTIMNSKSDEHGRISYRVIDGSHRMRAIIDYLTGQYPIEITKDKFYTYNELGPKAKNTILNSYSIDVIIYTELSHSEECEIFIKYNNVKPLHIGNRIKAEDNDVVQHWREILEQNEPEIKQLGPKIYNEKQDKFITTLASIYVYLYLDGDAQGGKKCLKLVTSLDEKKICTYEKSKETFRKAVILAISIFNDEKNIKESTHFKLLVILLYELHIRYCDDVNEVEIDKIVSCLKMKIESNTLCIARNPGHKTNIVNTITEITEYLNQKN